MASLENCLRLQMAIGESTVADMPAWRSWLHRLEVAVSERAALCVAVSISGFTRARAAVMNCTERYVRSCWGKAMIRGCTVMYVRQLESQSFTLKPDIRHSKSFQSKSLRRTV